MKTLFAAVLDCPRAYGFSICLRRTPADRDSRPALAGQSSPQAWTGLQRKG